MQGLRVSEEKPASQHLFLCPSDLFYSLKFSFKKKELFVSNFDNYFLPGVWDCLFECFQECIVLM